MKSQVGLYEEFDSLRLSTRLSSNDLTLFEDFERGHVLNFMLSEEAFTKDVRIEIQKHHSVFEGFGKLVQIAFNCLTRHTPICAVLNKYGLRTPCNNLSELVL